MTADKQKRRAFAREEFHKADADKSGTLDKDEILKVLEDVAHAFHLDLPKKEKILKLYDMCDKKDFVTICHLIKNPTKKTTWRVLRYEISNPKKTQKSGQSYAPGFTTPSDDECSSRETSVNIDETINGHGRKVARRVNDDE